MAHRDTTAHDNQAASVRAPADRVEARRLRRDP
jgi:hypothetical protein